MISSTFATYNIFFQSRIFYLKDVCHGFQNVVKPYRIGQSRLMAACDLVVFSGYLIMDFKCDSFSDGSYLVYGAFARITGLVKPDYVNRIVIVCQYDFGNRVCLHQCKYPADDFIAQVFNSFLENIHIQIRFRCWTSFLYFSSEGLYPCSWITSFSSFRV